MITRLIFAFLLSAFCFPVCGGTFHVQWLFRDASSNVLSIKQVFIQPIAAYGVDASTVIISGDRLSKTSDSTGSLIVSNLFNGRSYRVQLIGPFIQTTFTNSFDTNVTSGAVINGADPAYLAAPVRDTGVIAYSQTAADARFHQVAGDTSTNAIFRGTLKIPAGATVGYVFTATNSDGSGAWQANTGGSASNVFFLDSTTIGWSTTSGSNVAKLNAQVTNQWLADIRAASNSITANVTSLVTGAISVPLTNNDTRPLVFSGGLIETGVTQLRNLKFDDDDQYNIGSPSTNRPKHLYVAEEVHAGTFHGNGAALTALPASALTGTIDDARLPATITSDVTGNSATATTASAVVSAVTNEWQNYALTASNNIVSNTTIASLGLPAMTAFSAHATIPGASLSVGGYGWNFRLTKPMKVYALGKYRITGNTNVVTLQIMRTNDCAVVAQTVLNTSVGDSNKFNYAMLATPVLLTTNFSYAITFTFESGATDATLGITTGTETITTAAGIIPIYAVSPSVGCVGFSGWPSNSYGMVNFLSYPADEGVTAFTVRKVTDTTAGAIPAKYTSAIAAPESSVNVSLLNSYNAPPYDVGRFLKRPWRSMDPFLDYYPNAPDVGAFTNTILLWKTNGMLAAGWDAVSLDDGWQSTTRTTTNTLIWDTAKFPLGLPWLVNFAHTNGFKIGTYFGWSTNNCLTAFPGSPYWTFKDPVSGRIVENQLSNDVYNAYVWGFDMLFYDNSCGPQSQSEEEVRAAIRIFNDATLKNGLQSGRTNRGMIIQMGGNAFGNDLTNSMMPYDVALGVNLWTINGNENGLGSPTDGANTFYTKTKQTFEIPWFIQRGHYPTALLFNGSLPSASVRILLSSYVMAPLSILISTSSVTAGNLPYLTNSTWIRHYDDAATIPGRSIHTNAGRAEIWMRPFGSEVSATNLVCFINANTTNNTFTFTNSMLGYPSSQRLTFSELFTGTNVYVTNGAFIYPVSASNAVTWVVFPTPCVTNFYGPKTYPMAGTGTSVADPNSTTAAPHYFVDAWSQTAANNAAFAGFAIEPSVREVTVNYYSASDANASVYWQDLWTTYFNALDQRGGGVNWSTNIFAISNVVTFTSFNVPMPQTNAWKQLSWKPQASTNTSPRRWPFGLEIIKWK